MGTCHFKRTVCHNRRFSHRITIFSNSCNISTIFPKALPWLIHLGFKMMPVSPFQLWQPQLFWKRLPTRFGNVRLCAHFLGHTLLLGEEAWLVLYLTTIILFFPRMILKLLVLSIELRTPRNKASFECYPFLFVLSRRELYQRVKSSVNLNLVLLIILISFPKYRTFVPLFYLKYLQFKVRLSLKDPVIYEVACLQIALSWHASAAGSGVSVWNNGCGLLWEHHVHLAQIISLSRIQL